MGEFTEIERCGSVYVATNQCIKHIVFIKVNLVHKLFLYIINKVVKN